MIRIEKEKTVADFLAKNEVMLCKQEALNNLMLGLCHGMLNGKIEDTAPLLFSIYQDNTLHGQAIRTSAETPLLLTQMSELALSALNEKLKAEKIILKGGAVGPFGTTSTFANLWNPQSKLAVHQGIYALKKVINPPNIDGHMILADETHRDVAEKFAFDFVKTCFPNRQDKKNFSKKSFERNIKNKTLFLWKNDAGEIVSMAINTRNSINCATISWVYTPPEYRNNGYASMITAAL